MLSSEDIGVVIQARLGSQRLPGKIFKELPFNSGVTILEHIVSRCRRVASVHRVVVATSTESQDNHVETFCRDRGIEVFRGSLDDVLSRFYAAAGYFCLKHIVRVTSDNPCTDPGIISKTIQTHIDHDNQYTKTQGWPIGMNAEIVSFDALERVFHTARSAQEREHVTAHILLKKELFKVEVITDDSLDADLRLTVDTPADYALLCYVYDCLYPENKDFGPTDIKKLVVAKPWLKLINSHIYQKKVFSSVEEEIQEALQILDLHGLVHTKNLLLAKK